MKQHQKVINDAADALHKIIFKERSKGAHVVKYGYTIKGRQHYLDHSTGKTLSDYRSIDCSLYQEVF